MHFDLNSVYLNRKLSQQTLPSTSFSLPKDVQRDDKDDNNVTLVSIDVFKVARRTEFPCQDEMKKNQWFFLVKIM